MRVCAVELHIFNLPLSQCTGLTCLRTTVSVLLLHHPNYGLGTALQGHKNTTKDDDMHITLLVESMLYPKGHNDNIL